MSSYYGDKSQNVPSWDTLDAGDENDIVGTTEVSLTSNQAALPH